MVASLSQKELSSVVRIGQLAQECISEEHFGAIINQEMLKLFSSRSAVFMEFEQGGPGLEFGSTSSFGIDQMHSDRYSSHFHRMDPCFQEFEAQYGQGILPIVSTFQVVDSRQAYENSSYYQDFLIPTRVHQSVIFGLGSSKQLNGLIGLHRDKNQRAYNEKDHLIIQLITPYLSTAIMYRNKQRTLQKQNALFELILQSSNVSAYLLLNENYTCVGSGGAIDKVSPGGFDCAHDVLGVSIIQLLPLHTVTTIRDAVNAFTNTECSGSSIQIATIGNDLRASMVRGEQGELTILLSFLKSDLRLVTAELMRAYQLTAREVELVSLLELGLSNPQIAQIMSISRKTVENHLTHVYAKTGTHNRVSLLRQLSG
ncbi:MAG: helix-turn-helix transcriptional regulator [Pseudomonadota bacterium]